MNVLPKSKSENIVVQNLEMEVLIYDLTTNKAFCLNETSARVFEACDGKTSFDELKRKYQFTDDLIFLTLDGLKKEMLLDDKSEYLSPYAGMNRREVIRKVGLTSMVALPLISSVIAPTSANAASGGTIANCQVCTNSSNCISGSCRPAFPNNGTNICGPAGGGSVGQPGATFGAANQQTCTNVSAFQCCSGTGTFNNNLCTCN